MDAMHLPFAVGTMGGWSESALQPRLVREIHRNADTIGSHSVSLQVRLEHEMTSHLSFIDVGYR